MQNLPLFLMVLSAVLFLLATFWNPPNPPRYSLIAAGLFFFVVAQLVGK